MSSFIPAERFADQSDNQVKFLFRSVEEDFNRTASSLHRRGQEFDREAQLVITAQTLDFQRTVTRKMDVVSDQVTQQNIPFPRNQWFCGRDDVLRDIHQHLTQPSPSQLGIQRSCTIYGLGGVGKTQIALEYAYHNSHLYSHIFWIRAENEYTLTNSFADIGGLLGYGNEDATLAKTAEAAVRWLGTISELWLIAPLTELANF